MSRYLYDSNDPNVFTYSGGWGVTLFIGAFFAGLGAMFVSIGFKGLSQSGGMVALIIFGAAFLVLGLLMLNGPNRIIINRMDRKIVIQTGNVFVLREKHFRIDDMKSVSVSQARAKTSRGYRTTYPIHIQRKEKGKAIPVRLDLRDPQKAIEIAEHISRLTLLPLSNNCPKAVRS